MWMLLLYGVRVTKCAVRGARCHCLQATRLLAAAKDRSCDMYVCGLASTMINEPSRWLQRMTKLKCTLHSNSGVWSLQPLQESSCNCLQIGADD